MRLLFLIASLALATACGGPATPPKTNVNNLNAANTAKKGPVPVYGYEVVNTYPHDPKAFTEGLFFKDGFLYESTGGDPGESSIRKVELTTGKVLQKI